MKTKSERREERREKAKRKMDAGKKIKLLHRLTMERAAEAERRLREDA